MKKLLYAQCAEDCFSVEGTNKKEISEILRLHVKNRHHMDISQAAAEREVKSC